jgi:hypothetical protein
MFLAAPPGADGAELYASWRGALKELRTHGARPHRYLDGYGISSDTLGR